MVSENQALDWLAQVFQEPRDKITSETPRDAIASWDSLGVLMLMAELDEKFNIVLSGQEMQGMNKVGDVVAVLREHGQLH